MGGELGTRWPWLALTAVSGVGAGAVAARLWLDWRLIVIILAIGNGALIVAWVSSRRHGPGSSGLFLEMAKQPLAPELVLLPTVVSVRHNNSVTIAAIAVIALAALVRARHRNMSDAMTYLPAGALLACVAVAFRHGPYSIGTLFVAVAAVLVLLTRVVTREVAYSSLLAGLCLYLAANVVGWLAGVQSPSASVRVGGYESSGGLFGTRVFFPLARSINESSYIAVALIVAVVAMIRIRQRPRWYHWVGVVAGLIVILASNSRTPLLVALPLAVALVAAPRISRAAAPYGVGAAMVAPFLLTPLKPVIEWAAGRIASNEYLSRGQNVQEIVGLGTREIIWSKSIHFWDEHVSTTTQEMLGYGYNGHAKSGASAYYMPGIGDFLADRTALTMHNTVLQTLFDAGLIGAALLMAVTVLAVYRYGRDSRHLPILALAVVLGLSSAAEVTLAPGLSQTPVFLLLCLLAFVPMKRNPQPERLLHDGNVDGNRSADKRLRMARANN